MSGFDLRFAPGTPQSREAEGEAIGRRATFVHAHRSVDFRTEAWASVVSTNSTSTDIVGER